MDRSTSSLLGTPRDWAIDLAVAAVAGAFLGVIGPFGSFFNDAAAIRILYWVLAMWCATVVLGLVCRLAVALAGRLRIPIALALAGGIVIASAPLSMLVAAIARLFWPRIALTPLDWYWQCLVITGPIVAIYAVIHGFRAQGRGAVLEAVVRQAPPSAALPPAESQVLCLRMEDHYVRVHTLSGSRLVEGPLERVVASLGEAEGLRVHRSWWVSRAAVVAVEAEGRNLRLRLSNGLRAPVSRASVAKLRQVGWLAAET